MSETDFMTALWQRIEITKRELTRERERGALSNATHIRMLEKRLTKLRAEYEAENTRLKRKLGYE